MKASLDTNVIIHLYRAGHKSIIFDRFTEGVYIYEQIRYVELKNHGQDVLDEIDHDINEGKLQIIRRKQLQEWAVLSKFDEHVKENRLLYSPGDMGEIYAISLALTLGALALVTDDVKYGGPYHSLLRINYIDIMPFNFVDMLLLDYLEDIICAEETIVIFNNINEVSELNWFFESHLKNFIRRFWKSPFHEVEQEWMHEFCLVKGIKAKEKFGELSKLL